MLVYSGTIFYIFCPIQKLVNVTFSQRLSDLRSQKQSVLCVGLDPDPDRIPPILLERHALPEACEFFCRKIIQATSDQSIAFKLNFAFFEALGDTGVSILRRVLQDIPDDVLTIADAKRGDIGNSASFYARSVFEDLGFDSVTVSPYMGKDSVTPFLTTPGTCTFVLARTSNPGGSDFQLLDVGGEPLYNKVARDAVSWSQDTPGTTGLVVGATDIETLANLRIQLPDTPFLIPGVGSQGGSASDVMNASGTGPVLVNSSRAVIYADPGVEFAKYARDAAEATRLTLGS